MRDTVSSWAVTRVLNHQPVVEPSFTCCARCTFTNDKWIPLRSEDFRDQLCWAVLIIGGGGLGVILFIRYPDYPKQLVIAAGGLACLVTAIMALHARTKSQSIRRTWWALALFAITIVLMVLVHNFWPPLFLPSATALAEPTRRSPR